MVCANCLQKKPNIEKKKPNNFFWRQLLKKSQIYKIWRRKSQSANPGSKSLHDDNEQL